MKISIDLIFDNEEDLEKRTYELSDMLCFLRGFNACFEMNEDYTNRLDFINQNYDFITALNRKLKLKQKELEGLE